jgi:hypothetical protein
VSIDERLLTAQWILERNLAWIAAAETKVGVLVAIDTAMLAGLGVAFGSAAAKTPWTFVWSALAAGALVIAIGCASGAVLPRLDGPKKSLIFFGRIAEMAHADYADALRKASDSDLLDDCAAQIRQNAEIANKKHTWVRKAMLWSFVAAIPWLAAIVQLTKM